MSKYGRGPGVGIQSWVTDYLATGMVPRRIATDPEATIPTRILINATGSPEESNLIRFQQEE